MRKTIFILLTLSAALTLDGPAFAGKLGGPQKVNISGIGMSQHIDPLCPYRTKYCATGTAGGWGNGVTTTTPNPHGGCGVYGPNGVFIRCE